jgi:hypothetical protein
MAIDPQTLAAFKSAVLRADAVDKENKKLQADFKARLAKLVAAVKDKDVPMTKLLREQLATTVDKAEDCLSEIERFLRVDIADVQRDKDFAESKSAQIEKLVGVVSAAQSSLTRQFEAARQIDAAADKMLKAQATGKDAALREQAELERFVARRGKELRAMNDASTKLTQTAVVAFADRDVATLTKARNDIEGLGIAGELDAADRLDTAVGDFLKRWKDKGFGDEVDRGFDRAAAKLSNDIEGMRPWIRQSKDALERTRGYKLSPPDAKKALKTLDLPANVETKVAKAIALPLEPMAKAFDAIIKELKLKGTGKKMVDDLVKAGVV